MYTRIEKKLYLFVAHKFLKLSLCPVSIFEELCRVSLVEQVPVLLCFFLQLVLFELRYQSLILS